jgi:hypothetical protein
MSTIRDSYDDESDFEDTLASAEAQACTDWEIHFLADVRERYTKYGAGMYISERQKDAIDSIAEGNHRSKR